MNASAQQLPAAARSLDEDQILDLLARGMAQNVIAQTVGCTPGYISQLKAREDFAQKLAARRAVFMEESESRQERVRNIHNQYLNIEEKLLTSIERELGYMKSGEKLKLLQIVGAKKEPPATYNPNANEVAPVVSISLPNAVIPQFQLNAQREIIGLDGGTVFAPMTTQELKEVAAKALMRQNSLYAQDAKEVTPAKQQTNGNMPTNSQLLSLFSGDAPHEEIQI